MPTTSTPRNRVEQSGTITHDHLASWVTDGVIKDSGISAISGGGGGGGGVSFDTRAIAAGTSIDPSINMIQLNGFYAPGDNGGARYRRWIYDPDRWSYQEFDTGNTRWSDGVFQSADGAYWMIAEPEIDVRMFGAKGDDIHDDTQAIQSAVRFGVNQPIIVFIRNGTFKISISTQTPTAGAEQQICCISISDFYVTVIIDNAEVKAYAYGGLDPRTNWFVNDEPRVVRGATFLVNSNFADFERDSSITGSKFAQFYGRGNAKINGQCPRNLTTHPMNAPQAAHPDDFTGNSWDNSHHAIFYAHNVLHVGCVVEGLEVCNYMGEILIGFWQSGDPLGTAHVRHCLIHDTLANGMNFITTLTVMHDCEIHHCSAGIEHSGFADTLQCYDNYVHDMGWGFVLVDSLSVPPLPLTDINDICSVHNNVITRCAFAGIFGHFWISGLHITDNVLTDCGYESDQYRSIETGLLPINALPDTNVNVFIEGNHIGVHEKHVVYGIGLEGDAACRVFYAKNNTFFRTTNAIQNGLYIDYPVEVSLVASTTPTFVATIAYNDFRNTNPASGYIFDSKGLYYGGVIQTISNIYTDIDNEHQSSLTDAASIVTDARGGETDTFTVTLTDNRTLANPIGLTKGKTYTWIIKQDNVGSKTLAFDTMFKFASGASSTLSTISLSKDRLVCKYDGTDLFCDLTKRYL